MTEELSYFQTLADKMFSKTLLEGYSTGYTSLDALVRGIKPGTLTVIAGSAGTGKSLFALNLLKNTIRLGIDVEYYDLENSETLSNQRFYCIWTGENTSVFRNETNKERVVSTMYEYSEKFTYYGHEYLTSSGKDLASQVYNYIKASRAKVFLVDPLQALENETISQNNFNEQGKIIRSFKELAQKKEIAILFCHHMRKSMSRSGEFVTDFDDVKEVRYQVPTLEDLKGSSKIGDFATDVWGLVRTSSADTKEGRGKTLLRVLKNRSGLKGDVKFFFDEDNLRFYETNKSEDVLGLFLEGGI